MEQKPTKKAALYCRTARADMNAIQHQLDILRQYAAEHGLDYEEYVDNGYTGLQSERPAFQQMLRDIQAGKIGKLIALNFSRYGRNSLEILSLLNKQISQYCIEVLCVHEGNVTAEISKRAEHFKSLVDVGRDRHSR